MYCTSALVESITECLMEYKSPREFRTKTASRVNSVKRGNVFVIWTLHKVNSAGRVTLLPMICINVQFFLRIFQKLSGQHERNIWSLAGVPADFSPMGTKSASGFGLPPWICPPPPFPIFAIYTFIKCEQELNFFHLRVRYYELLVKQTFTFTACYYAKT